MDDLTLTEELILWAVWRLKNNAYGVTIRKHVSKSTQRIFPYGTLYNILSKLARKGLVIKTSSEPIPVRGGRSKNYYKITSTGIDALQNAAKLKRILWNRKTEEALEES